MLKHLDKNINWVSLLLAIIFAGWVALAVVLGAGQFKSCYSTYQTKK